MLCLLTIAFHNKCKQDLLKLERLREELVGRNGGQPTFAQWATAAGIDQKTLRKRLNDGTFCKDKMIKSNIRLVISIAKNYQNAGLSLQDLVQVLALAALELLCHYRMMCIFSILILSPIHRKGIEA